MALAAANSIIANVGFVVNAETYITTNTALVANINTAINQLGNTFRITIGGVQTTTGEKLGAISYNLKLGKGGNVADNTILQLNGFRDVGESPVLGAEFLLVIRSNPVSNVINVAAFGCGFNPKDFPQSVANVTSIAGASNLIFGVSFSGGDGISNVVFQTAVIEQIA